MSKFTIEYDDQLDEAVNKVSEALHEHGLTIEYGEGGDGTQEYVILKLEE